MSHFENHKELDNHVDDLWRKSLKSDVINDFENGVSLQDVITKNKVEKPSASPDTVKCSDGRCFDGRPGGVYAAGGGMLMDDKEFKEFLEANPSITTITSHHDCGAAKLTFASYESDGRALPQGVTNPAEFAVWWAKDKAQKFGLDYQHLSAEELNNPHHHEAGLWVDATGKFDPSLIKGMPNFFISQAKGKSFVKEADVLTGIGLGDHGFGDRFTPKKPFYICIIAKDEAEKERITSLTEEAVKKYGDRVVIKSAISPF